ncbi:MAG TPA: translation factor GTPase family protein, partial [Planctomycetia bacterium]|nr:translation factor GTPase family protein [Planctomycetia bacterium]
EKATRVLNATRDKKENATQLRLIHADKLTELESAGAGSIVGVVGLKNSVTGDTLCDPKHPVILEKIGFPDTVISVSIEPESSGDKQKLADVLAIFQKEDPTFRVKVSEETGETLISGMGELHLEVLRNKMVRDHNLKVRVGKPRVSYRETLRKPVTVEGSCDRQLPTGKLFVKLQLAFAPIPSLAAGAIKTPFRFIRKWDDETIPPVFFATVEQALLEECTAGGLAGYPLTGIEATLLGGSYVENESNEQAIRFACAHGVREALDAGGIDILEPIMKLEVVTPEEYLGPIAADLGSRRASIEANGVRGIQRTITAHAPLRTLFGYTTDLRSLSQGRANFSMEPADYAIAPPEVTKSML